MTTVFVLRLAGRLPRQQPQRVGSTAGEGAPPPSPPRERRSSARKVPKSDATGGRRGSRGRRRRRGGSATSSTSLSQRTASSAPPSASLLMPTGFLMRRDVPRPTRYAHLTEQVPPFISTFPDIPRFYLCSPFLSLSLSVPFSLVVSPQYPRVPLLASEEQPRQPVQLPRPGAGHGLRERLRRRRAQHLRGERQPQGLPVSATPPRAPLQCRQPNQSRGAAGHAARQRENALHRRLQWCGFAGRGNFCHNLTCRCAAA